MFKFRRNDTEAPATPTGVTEPGPVTGPAAESVPGPDAVFPPDPALQAGVTLAPYAPIVPGVWMGWPKAEPVIATLRQDPAEPVSGTQKSGTEETSAQESSPQGLDPGAPAATEITLEACDQAAWLTLEVELTWDRVRARGIVGLGMDVSCAPVGRMGARLRLPLAGGGHQDVDGPVAVLRPELQRLAALVTLPPGTIWQPIPARPKFILWFTTEPKRLRFERLFVL